MPEWNREQIATLERLWLAGTKAADIALAIGAGTTRNAVIGKAARLCLPARAAGVGRTVSMAPDRPKAYPALRRPKGLPPGFKPIKFAPAAHPLVRRLIGIMNQQQCSIQLLCQRVGMSSSTFSSWRTVNPPNLPLLIAAFNVLGYELEVVEIVA